LGVIVLTVWAARRMLDRRSFASLGFALDRMAGLELLAGFLIAGLMQAATFVVEWAFGWLRVDHFAWETHAPAEIALGFAAMTVVFVLVGFYEELLSRGYWLQNISDGLNRFWGVLCSSSVFALLHFGNPNARWIAMAGLVGAGLFLAFAYVRTNRLWLPIGLHFGWNLFEGPVFGFPVSGVKTMVLIEQTVDGPASWTGGAFGPEAGLIQIVSLAVGFALVLRLTRGRHGSRAASALVPPAV
jgi:membrane protease YdiL (CAAX protease family)